MIAPIDFTQCERLPSRAYNGANGKKIAVRYDGDVPFLSYLQRAFYKVYIIARYEVLFAQQNVCKHPFGGVQSKD